jgi:hypothetical protein
MKNDLKNEKWSLVKPPHKFTNNLKIEVSNLGRIRTTTKIAEKRVLKGTLINGYPIARFKLFKKRDSQTEAAFDVYRKKIAKNTATILELKRTLKTLSRKHPNYSKTKEQIEKTSNSLTKLKADYKIKFRADELSRTINYAPLIHRLVADAFLKKPSSKQTIVSHIDHNKRNNAVSNLKWMTVEENSKHQQKSPQVIREKKSRIGKRPSRSKGYKLNESRVAQIKQRIKKGDKLSKLSKTYDVSETQLLRIKRGLNWGDVKPK